MSTLTIVEAQGVAKQATGDIQAMMLPALTTKYVTFTGTPGYSAVLNSATGLVYLYADASCTVLASTTSSASVGSVSAGGIPLVSSTGQYFGVPKGQSIYFSVVAKG